MSVTGRPSIPRPVTQKPSSAPPPPASGIAVRQMRGPMPTLDIDDADIVGVSVAPLRKSSSPPPPPASVRRPLAKARQSMKDPTEVLFERLYTLAFVSSPGEAAELCAETLAIALGARSVVIHKHDLGSGELRAIGAHGEGDFDIIGSAEASDDDLVASAVICNSKQVTMKFDGDLPRMAPKRLHLVGAPRTVVAAPALSWGRCLAIVEVIDADERFNDSRVADSVAYVAEQFARFLATHAA